MRGFAHTVRMDSLLKQAKDLQKEIVSYRRFLHQHAEVGFDLPRSREFVKEKLTEMGYTPQDCGQSIVAIAGKNPEKGVILLRADMDGLPIKEKSGLPFACKTGNMHACGHDMHTAMLLGAAKLLKVREKELNRGVKLLFQPAEEILEGAKNALANGVLGAPPVKTSAMLHAIPDLPIKSGTLVVAGSGVGAPAADYFRAEILGKGCHGASPQNGIDALTAGAHAVIALQELSARELVSGSAVLTVGKLQAGDAGNAIADRAVLQGTLRAFDEETRAFVKKRLKEIISGIAKTFRARAKIAFEGGCPSLLNDEKTVEFALNALREAVGEKGVLSAEDFKKEAGRNGGSEDFAYLSRETPSVMIAIAAGRAEDGYKYPLHHPQAVFDESALYYGAAAYSALALAFNK